MRLFEDVPRSEMISHGNNPVPYRDAKASFEKNYLVQLLSWADGNVKRAAQKAGRDRKGLYILMDKHGLDPKIYRKSKKARR